MAKIPKMTLATRNPVAGEFMRALLRVRSDLSAKKPSSILTSPEQRGLNQDSNDCKGQK